RLPARVDSRRPVRHSRAPMNLAPLMKPASIAVVGASQRMTRATRVVANLQRFGYAGRIFPINPRYSDVLGLPCYPDLASTPERADTVVVAIPAEQVPGVLRAAVASGVRGAVVLSSGFAEAGSAGQKRQAGLTVEDYLAYLVEDDDTAVVGAFVEGFKKPETFRRAAATARERRKPIVVLKVGRSENARQAMLAHTGSLAGTPEIIEAVLR